MADPRDVDLVRRGTEAIAKWRERSRYARLHLSGAILSEADLSGADLTGADLCGAYFSKAKLSGASLSGANLSEADLSGANLSEAYLIRASLSGANLSGADLSGADLSEAYLSRATLSEASLCGTNLRGANLSEANIRKADLRGANLSEADLGRADLSGVDLGGANIREADLRGTNLIEADLSGADLGGADLSGANLSGADLSGADLSRADVRGAQVEGAVFENCNVTAIAWSELVGLPKRPNSLRKGVTRIVGVEAELFFEPRRAIEFRFSDVQTAEEQVLFELHKLDAALRAEWPSETEAQFVVDGSDATLRLSTTNLKGTIEALSIILRPFAALRAVDPGTIADLLQSEEVIGLIVQSPSFGERVRESAILRGVLKGVLYDGKEYPCPAEGVQKQVEYLEKHPAQHYSFHNSEVYLLPAGGTMIENSGQMNYVGRDAIGNDMRQSWGEVPADVDLRELSSEIAAVLVHLKKALVESDDPQLADAVASVSHAKKAAEAGERSNVLGFLCAAGNWVLEAAKAVPAAVVAELTKAAMAGGNPGG